MSHSPIQVLFLTQTAELELASASARHAAIDTTAASLTADLARWQSGDRFAFTSMTLAEFLQAAATPAIRMPATYDVCLLESSATTSHTLGMLHQIQGQGNELPLILLLHQADAAFVATAIAQGVSDCLVRAEITPALLDRSIQYAIAQFRLQQALQKCKVTEERYALAVRGANDGIWDWDLTRNTVYFSSRWKSMLGYGETEIGQAIEEWFRRIHPEDFYRVKRDIQAHLDQETPQLEVEYRLQHQNGSYRWMLCRGVAVQNLHGHAVRIAGSQTDITAWKQAEEKLVHEALHDTLTGLPNRVFLMERLRQAVQRSQCHANYLFAVLFVDLDRFKVINDSLGHMVGDQLLVAIAQRLSGCLQPSDTIARLGGDEFVILLADVKDVNSVTQLAEKVQQELTLPFNLEGNEVFTGASIGIAFSDVGYENPEDLLRDADIAMYRAKAHGRARYAIFHPGMHSHAVAMLQLETDLRRAISRNELQLHYQPIVSMRSRHITGFEALVRWNHPLRGMVSPGEFIPLAEETGLITSIGWWVLREACQQMQQWQQAFPTTPPLTMNVNLSGKQFTPQLTDQVRQILQDTGLPAQHLKLEITESMLMENAEAAVITLAQLKQLGVQLAIDDFGTGYSSLNYLHRFPIDTLKCDRSFISRIDVDGEQLAIVRTIITLAWNLGMEVVAEGVETMKHYLQLRSLQCDYAQGYFFHKPLPPAAIESLLQEEWQAGQEPAVAAIS